MERLTYWCDDGMGNGEWRVNVGEWEVSGPHIERLAIIENVLGDTYDLDRLRELVEADKAGRWIPCSSGVMPEAGQEVRVTCKTSTGYRYQCLAVYIPAGVYRDDSGYSWDWECCDEYDEARDDYMVNPGWYESIHNWDDYNSVGIADTVTHWMPLSDLPEEVQGNG